MHMEREVPTEKSSWLVQNAVLDTVAEGKVITGDLGGKSKCSEFTKAIIDNMQ